MDDYLVIGAGISGAAAAFELAAHGATILLEAENAPGYHSTGRSAALYTRHFGGPVVRRINRASAAFFEAPPPGFDDRPLVSPRGGLTVAAPGEEQALAASLAAIARDAGPGHGVREIAREDALTLAPVLRLERVAAATYEAGVRDIDVAALHQAYLRGFKERGGRLLANRRIASLERRGGSWRAVTGRDGEIFDTRVVVNAAGAWAGAIGALASASDIGLVAKKRTAIVLDAPEGMDAREMPVVDYVATDAYLKPDAGRIMVSPGDATPCEPQDAQPDEYDIAVLAEWVMAETRIPVRRIAHSWAGLRSFVRDEAPVVGFDAAVPDFFWLAGQGGYGIMMAPALARATASLVVSGAWPSELLGHGVQAADVSPERLA